MGSFSKNICHCTVEEAAQYVQMHGQELAPNQLGLLEAALEGIGEQSGYLQTKVLMKESVAYYSVI